ncbi:dTMP kinase [Gudongella oleilytica]|jgi:dTMP kinase|uniref:dTMP kinase n=1 Tax=Gudongella oleilytica TaxID=1582259 RepID=UPI000FF8AF51|nr:dTMP kinase [Gudongella oleilytica]MDY0255930.1 dTMP kinase [Gudongella oleilytica]
MSGLFITLEGPDGSGKSTMIGLIGQYLKEQGIEHVITREPGGTAIGEKIRGIIIDRENINMGPETEALLFAASRAQHVHEKILPAVEEGKVVVCDRFLLSSLAYQGVGRGLGIQEVKAVNEFGLRGMTPDLILFFHVDPEVTLLRKTKEGGDRLEEEGGVFHREVYEGYMTLLRMYPDNVVVIDAEKSVEEVYAQTIAALTEVLKSKEETL